MDALNFQKKLRYVEASNGNSTIRIETRAFSEWLKNIKTSGSWRFTSKKLEVKPHHKLVAITAHGQLIISTIQAVAFADAVKAGAYDSFIR